MTRPISAAEAAAAMLAAEELPPPLPEHALEDAPAQAQEAAPEPVAPRSSTPAQVPHESALVLFNEKAGGVTAVDRQKLLELLVQLGVRKFEVTEPGRLGPNMFRQAKGHDLFVVLGGDGTARAAAAHAPKDAPPLVLLPGGTLNILPHALYGELSWPEALKAAIERGRVSHLSCGRANGEPFFVAAMFGAPTLLARAREAVREHAYLKAARRFNVVAQRTVTVRMRARPQGGRMQKAEIVGLLAPAFVGEVEGDHLEWARLDTCGVMDMVRLGVRSLAGDWRNDPSIDRQECGGGDIVSLGLIPATLDGEPRTFMSRVKITFERKGPKVITLDKAGDAKS